MVINLPRTLFFLTYVRGFARSGPRETSFVSRVDPGAMTRPPFRSHRSCTLSPRDRAPTFDVEYPRIPSFSHRLDVQLLRDAVQDGGPAISIHTPLFFLDFPSFKAFSWCRLRLPVRCTPHSLLGPLFFRRFLNFSSTSSSVRDTSLLYLCLPRYPIAPIALSALPVCF